MTTEPPVNAKHPTLAAVQEEIVERIYFLGTFMAMFLEPQSAASLFAHPDYDALVANAKSIAEFHEIAANGGPSEPSEPERFSIWHEAGVVYDFAFHGQWDLQGSYQHPFKGMRDLILRLEAFYATTNASVTYNEHASQLKRLTLTGEVIERAFARLLWVKFQLIGEPETLTIRDFALVADVSDRTIRNILSLDEKADASEKSGLVMRKEGSKSLIDLRASLPWTADRPAFQVRLYDSLYEGFPILRDLLEAERQTEGLDVVAFAEGHKLPLAPFQNLLNNSIPLNPIILDCAAHIAEYVSQRDETLQEDTAAREQYRQALFAVLLKRPVPFCCYWTPNDENDPLPFYFWTSHDDRDQWEETGELIKAMSGYFKKRQPLLQDYPKLRWLLNWSEYLR